MIEKLSVWAKRNGVHPKTAYKWYVNGTMPFPTEKLGPKTIVVHTPDDDEKIDNIAVIYARVSSSDQKQDLDNQALRLAEYCIDNNIVVDKIVKEISSGLNEKRPQLNKILSVPAVNKEELDDDLVEDVIAIMTSYAKRLPGKRSAKNRAKKDFSVIEGDQ